MADIILIQPRFGIWEEAGTMRSFPLALLSSVRLAEKEFSIVFIDIRFESSWKAQLLAELQKNPLCVAMSAMTGYPIHAALEVSSFIKSFHPEVPIVWGGVHPSLFPGQTLQHDHIDFVVIGEGEQTFLELARALQQKQHRFAHIAGLGYKEQETIKLNAQRSFCDLDSLPEPPYHLAKMKRYPFLPMETSRGCVFGCKYCYNPTYNARKWRSQSPEHVVERISYFINTLGHTRFAFIDDNFFVDLKRVEQICRLIIKKGLKFSWGCQGIRVDSMKSMDLQLIKLLERAGAEYLSYGIETGSQKMLDFINKGITVSDVISVNRKLRNSSMKNFYNFMAGFPTETIADLRKTADLMYRLVKENNNSRIAFLAKFHPYPGTWLFDYCKQHYDFKTPQSLEEWSRFDWDTNVRFPWLSEKSNKIIEMMNLSALGLNPAYLEGSKMKPFTGIFSRLSSYRFKHFDFTTFPIERFAKSLIIPKNYM